MNIIYRYLLFSIILCLCFSCSQQKNVVKKQNQAMLYKPSVSIVRPEYIVYHTSDTVSQLFIKIFINELLFNQANPEQKLMAKLRFSYELSDITDFSENAAVIDSFSKVREFPYVSGKQYVVLSLPVKSIRGKNYRLKVTVYDMVREIGNTGYVFINKKNMFSAQNFKLFSSENNAPLFVRYIGAKDSVRIQLNKEIRYFYVNYQRENTMLPQPPFSSLTEQEFAFKADSVWKVSYDVKRWYRFPYEGLYLIQTDSSVNQGVFLGNYGKSFPRVTESKSMISPIEYLSTTEEYKKIVNEENAKLAVDSFWLNLSSNLGVSRELIRIYYTRMNYANMYFTSFKPGWKTDRGMIYMIFGPPSNIRKTAASEIWEYYLKQEARSVLIKFLKTESPYSDNHYIMQHDASFTPFWREAVYTWRTGKAFNLED